MVDFDLTFSQSKTKKYFPFVNVFFSFLNADIRKTKKALTLKGMFSETTYVFVLVLSNEIFATLLKKFLLHMTFFCKQSF